MLPSRCVLQGQPIVLSLAHTLLHPVHLLLSPPQRNEERTLSIFLLEGVRPRGRRGLFGIEDEPARPE